MTLLIIYEIKERKSEKGRKGGETMHCYNKKGKYERDGENMINLAKEIGNWFIKISFRYKLISYLSV